MLTCHWSVTDRHWAARIGVRQGVSISLGQTLTDFMYVQHSFEEPMLQIHVPSFAVLKVEQPPNAEKGSLQNERPKKQYSV